MKRRCLGTAEAGGLGLDAEAQEFVRGAAEQVHQAALSRWGATDGLCKDASIALAMALSPLGEPVAVCQGTVVAREREHSHAWCRIGHLIIDATADQFGADPPLVAHEVQLPHYREEQFFLFNPGRALGFLGLLDVPG